MKRQTFTIAAAMAAILFIFSASSSTILLAQEGRGTGRLVGFVLDTDKNPIEGVKLTLEYLKYTNRLTATSNEKGKWIFQGIGPGDARVTAVKEGFAKGGIGLYVSGANRNPVQHIVLKRLSELPKSELKEDDKNAAARSNFKKADALYKERKFEDALALYQDFQKMQPKLYKIGINIANCYLEMTQYDQAIEEYQKVLDKMIEENPDLTGNSDAAKLYASIGDTYMRQDKLKEAEKYFKKSIEIDPSDYALAYNVAEILFAAGKTDDAIKYYDLAIKIKPDWPKAYLQRGYAYLNKGDMKKAVESMKKYLELDPDSPDAEGVKEVIKSLQ